MPRKPEKKQPIPERILDKQYDESIKEFVYLVKWESTPNDYLHDSWECESTLIKSSFADLVIQFNESLEKFDLCTPSNDVEEIV